MGPLFGKKRGWLLVGWLEHIASIFRVEEIIIWARNQSASRCSDTARRYIPEDGTLHNHRCENLKPYILICVLFVGDGVNRRHRHINLIKCTAGKLYGRNERVMTASEWLSEWEWEPAESLPSRGGVTRPLISLKRRPHFKPRKSLERRKIWPWVPIPRTTVLARASSSLLEWTIRERRDMLTRVPVQVIPGNCVSLRAPPSSHKSVL
jgi:hypothetical protein